MLINKINTKEHKNNGKVKINNFVGVLILIEFNSLPDMADVFINKFLKNVRLIIYDVIAKIDANENITIHILSNKSKFVLKMISKKKHKAVGKITSTSNITY